MGLRVWRGARLAPCAVQYAPQNLPPTRRHHVGATPASPHRYGRACVTRVMQRAAVAAQGVAGGRSARYPHFMSDTRQLDSARWGGDEATHVPLGTVLRVATAVWSLIALLMCLNVTASSFIERDALPSWRSLVPAIVEWYLWVPLTPLVLWLGMRFPVVGGRGWTRFLPHVGGVVGATVLRGIVYASTTTLIARTPLT